MNVIYATKFIDIFIILAISVFHKQQVLHFGFVYYAFYINYFSTQWIYFSAFDIVWLTGIIFVIGYCWTDLGSWPLENPSGRNWVDFIRDLPEDAPGRKAYQKFLSVWKGGDGQIRDLAFLRLIAREYFRVVGGAQRKHAPGRLIFGERFGLSAVPRFNTLLHEVLEEMLPYVDGIAIQPPFRGGFPREQLDSIHKKTGKPILLCDFALRFTDGDKDVRSWKPEKDSVAAGKAYADYVKAALLTDYVVGVFWCNPVDTPKGFGKPGVKQGFFGPNLTERPGLHEAVRKLNAHRDELTPKL